MRPTWSLVLLGTLGLARPEVLQAAEAEKPKFTPEQIAFYEKEVVPVLKAHCLKCHGDDPKKLRGELDLRTRSAALKGGESGKVVVPGDVAKSLLVQAINHSKPGYEMPPTGKLKPDQISVLTKWVADGLAYPPHLIGEVAVDVPGRKVIPPEARNYWAYKPVQRPEVPKVPAELQTWIKTPIDAFIVDQLQKQKLTPSPIAEKRALVRRAYYDLLGLPPTPEQVDAFLKDTRPDAWEKLIDQLLASPHYGEKWGRHWLDVVRYGETNGYERDSAKPYVWRYRDYVINSFNADKPYAQFIKEQIAGDELPRSPRGEEIVATGFYRLGLWDDEPSDPKQAQMDAYDDYVTIIGQGFLGMTLNCARCHDHKGDPILQEDYYKLVAFVRDVKHYSNDRNPKNSSTISDITPAEQRKKYEDELARRMARMEELTKKMEAIENEAIKDLPAADQRASEGPDRPRIVAKIVPLLKQPQKQEYSDFRRERDQLRSKPIPPQELALSVNNCSSRPPQTVINIRGNAHAEGAPVEPGYPQVLGFPDPVIPAREGKASSAGRRTVLAEWLASQANPLTARVMMNRVWQYHFGKGLVPTANDFGKLGEPVTHPALLDWLASEFANPQQASQAWTLKRMHKLIMTSAVYQQSSRAREEGLKIDPANTYLWRFNMRRLAAEEVRDSILAVSGELDLTLAGPSVYPKIPAEVLAGQSVPGSGWHYNPGKPKEGNRRSVYVHVKRSLQVPILIQHDQADADNSCPVRYTTTVPTQALGMLNSEFTNEQARALALRLVRDAGNDLPKQVALGIRLTTSREGTRDEIAQDVAFIEKLMKQHKLTAEKALAQYCLLLLNTNEFITID